MNQISELEDILNESFNWNKARMACFVKMLMALIITRTVNLTKMACIMSGKAEKGSRYRRIQRFISGFSVDFDVTATLLNKRPL